MKMLYCGAEAEIRAANYLGLPAVEKRRVEKKYRVKALDKRIRSERVRREAGLIIQARTAVRTPRIYDVDLDSKTITMQRVKGVKLREMQDHELVRLAPRIGAAVAGLHKSGIIHADLTTSNMLLEKNLLYFIDFGLAFKSDKLEDKAVDLIVFKKMLKSTHFSCFEKAWQAFLSGYKPDKSLLLKTRQVEARVRYAEK